MNRRHFLRIGMAAGVAIAMGRKVARNAPDVPTVWKCTVYTIDYTKPVSPYSVNIVVTYEAR